jgi:hypothetical protein
MANASGVAKLVIAKKEATWGVAPGTGSAQYLRRVTSDLSLVKSTYSSNEIRSDYQDVDFRHGMRTVTGSIDGELSPGTYEMFMAAALRKAFAAVTAVSGLTLTVAASGTNYTITRSTGDFLTSGIKVGMVVRATAGLNALSLNKNLFVLALSSTVMTVLVLNGTALTVEAGVAACTITVPGMKSYVPLTGHTDDSFAIEHWFSDIAQSELHLGLKVQSMAFNLPPTGMATIKTAFLGKDVTTGVAAYYVTPTAALTSGVLAAVNGAVMVNGTPIAMLTGLNFTINGNMSTEPVVGSNSAPEIFEGRVLVDGQMTAYFQDATMRDYFLNETEVSIAAALTTGSLGTADFLAFSFPRVKMGGASKNDGEKGIVQTIPFKALLPTTGGSGVANEQSTLAIHDSLAV